MFGTEKGRKEGVEPSFLGPQPSVLTIGRQPSLYMFILNNNLSIFNLEAKLLKSFRTMPTVPNFNSHIKLKEKMVF